MVTLKIIKCTGIIIESSCYTVCNVMRRGKSGRRKKREGKKEKKERERKKERKALIRMRRRMK